MAQISAEIKKSIKYWKKHKLIALVSIFPPLLICLLFVGAFHTTGITNIVVVNEDAATSSVWTERFLEVMETRTGTIPYFNLDITDEETAENMFEMHETFAILYIPEGFGDSVESGYPLSLTVRFTAIHEDISKNVRLGIEARIYDFVKLYDLDTEARPGIVVVDNLENDSLPRYSYMMAGIIVWTMVFFGLLIGGALGANENEGGTKTYVWMAPKGEYHSLIGKWLATIVISAVMLLILVACYILFFDVRFPSFLSVIYLLILFIVLNSTFALPGVLYGMKVGDFRLVPAPMIILSITLWLVSGALNPLEFSSGYAFFKYLPTAAGIQIMSYGLFERGEALVGQSFLILAGWVLVCCILFLTYLFVKQKQIFHKFNKTMR